MSDTFDHWVLTNQSRFPPNFVSARLAKENAKAALLNKQETSGYQRWFVPRRLIQCVLTCSGFKHIGANNAANIQKKIHRLPIKDLPENFEGFRILQISDPHFNQSNAISDALFKTIQDIDCDLCVLTGDYRFRSFGPLENALAGLTKIRQMLSCDTVAILGNHDSIQMVPVMESLGITVLLNESFVVSRDNKELTFVGVDDPSYYKLDNLGFALSQRPIKSSSASVLLAHSPHLYQQGAKAGFDAYLCGHTHGGQICLPSAIPIKTSKSFPRYLNSGQWNHNRMRGYTSVGAGVSVVEARFFCPPEVTIHILTKNMTQGSMSIRL